ncbi:MAG: hypothetical protein ACLQO1_06365, partial [Steroidobacteraceae bacterium]
SLKASRSRWVIVLSRSAATAPRWKASPAQVTMESTGMLECLRSPHAPGMLECLRFAGTLADTCAQLGVNVDRYSFIATDSHRLLLAGLPAHN